jgi:hypothetical protein
MKDRMSALGWAIDGAADALPGVDNGIGAQQFVGELTNDAYVLAGSLATAHIGFTPGTDGIGFAERVGGRAARFGRIMTGGRNYRQMRSAVRAGRSFGRTVPVVALGVAVFTAFYSGTSAAICALEE